MEEYFDYKGNVNNISQLFTRTHLFKSVLLLSFIVFTVYWIQRLMYLVEVSSYLWFIMSVLIFSFSIRLIVQLIYIAFDVMNILNTNGKRDLKYYLKEIGVLASGITDSIPKRMIINIIFGILALSFSLYVNDDVEKMIEYLRIWSP